MSRPRPRSAQSASAKGPDPPGVLDWGDGRHWSSTALPCRYCDTPTHLRDSKSKPAHKACAEQALATQAADAAAAYQKEALTP
ncbi:hypothetical protein [Peterkaempfera griseoplana]|uniref:hypothetical protein n=1 Tax=Peterkaempfera griseoplana TaxID=66896 RepID=UPI0006E44D88|nr:hypothetical protein [Peterkaempfera griseoplana]